MQIGLFTNDSARQPHLGLVGQPGCAFDASTCTGDSSAQADGLGVSMISCWEVAKLVEIGRLQLTLPTTTWLDQALTYPGIELLDLTLSVVVESTQLPGPFHRDPADQMIVATARIHGLKLPTVDEKTLQYPHVQALTL